MPALLEAALGLQLVRQVCGKPGELPQPSRQGEKDGGRPGLGRSFSASRRLSPQSFRSIEMVLGSCPVVRAISTLRKPSAAISKHLARSTT